MNDKCAVTAWDVLMKPAIQAEGVVPDQVRRCDRRAAQPLSRSAARVPCTARPHARC